jgi:nucleoside-triphosphatase THEP1
MGIVCDHYRQLLQSADDSNASLIIIDELGPVELKAKGWADEIERLINNTSIPLLRVVRTSILKKVLRQWTIGEVMLIDISKDSAENEINTIIDFILK